MNRASLANPTMLEHRCGGEARQLAVGFITKVSVSFNTGAGGRGIKGMRGAEIHCGTNADARDLIGSNSWPV